MDVFVKAIRLGGISAAARDLHMSPAMAAKHLDALEARLGTTLVQRSTRRLSLTEAGTDYFRKGRTYPDGDREAEAEASSRSITAGRCASVPATFGVLHLASLIPAFSARHPEVTIELGFNDRYVDLLKSVGMSPVRIGRLANSALVARKLVAMRVVLCAAPSYLARRTPARLADLAAITIVWATPTRRLQERHRGRSAKTGRSGADLRIDVFRQWRGLGSRCHRGPRAGLWATLYCGRGASRRAS
jgi:DNA-binding transcriptional LysR family regulator